MSFNALDIDNCARCGMCLSVCPIYSGSLIESDSPRARLALIKARSAKVIDETNRYTDTIFNCTQCKACAFSCPSGIHPDKHILQERTLVKNKPYPIQKYVLDSVVPFPSRLKGILLPMRLYQKSPLKPLLNTRLKHGLPSSLLELEKMIPEIQGSPLYSGKKMRFHGGGNTQYRVGYFIGCAQNLIFSNVANATIQVLLRNQCEVIIPDSIKCCGIPHLGYGDLNGIKSLARQNIDAFEAEDITHIVTDCASCGSTLKYYAELLNDDPEYRQKAISFVSKVRDISEFLTREIDFSRNFKRLQFKATYHEPCHLGRSQGIKEEPRSIMKEILGSNYIEMSEADRCCGGAGSYMLTHRNESMAILDRKMNNIAATEADTIITACPGCELQLAHGIKRSQKKYRLLNITELIQLAYK